MTSLSFEISVLSRLPVPAHKCQAKAEVLNLMFQELYRNSFILMVHLDQLNTPTETQTDVTLVCGGVQHMKGSLNADGQKKKALIDQR